MDYARKVGEVLKVRCVHLKTKSSYTGMPGPGDVESDIDTAGWWCERTCAALGPDGETARPATCERRGRICYQAPLRPPEA
jgi:hypothetical protein